MRFDKYVRTILEQAGREAQSEGLSTIEAQHLLLAIAAQPETIAGQVLRTVGLDHGRIRELLDREFEQSLAAAGESLANWAPPRSSAPEPATTLGTSVKHALERGVARVPKPVPAHLLLGILEANVGTVPRALALAGIDRADLARLVRQQLTDEGG